MGVIGSAIATIFGGLFGDGRNVVKETAEVFRVNAEAQAGRNHDYSQAALAQFAAEFAGQRKGWYDRFIDGLNRLPRPALALGTLSLFVSAMIDPVWFAARMQGIVLVPEPLWWLMGVIVSFYFGARHQMKKQSFQREIATSVALAPNVIENIGALNELEAAGAGQVGIADTGTSAAAELDVTNPSDNPALQEWRAGSNI